ncbi:37S ribosomal protein S16, mitochondrial [Naganishia albida]|nr:37S ribosomal protein S16, mitochondrial [Naganishia albida]
MVVRLRLARHGRKNTPFYHLVAINSSKRRDALPLEKLGEYDPIPRPPPTSTSLAHAVANSFHLASRAPEVTRESREKRIVWDVERIRYWLGVGAQPTESVVKLLERAGVLEGDHKWRISPARRGKGKPKEVKTEGDE